MTADRVASLVRFLTVAGSRRRALLTALAGLLGQLGRAQVEETWAAKSGTCKPACPECTTCKKGKCRKTRHGKKCKKGKCQPGPNGTPCTVPSGGATCQNGTCTCPTGQQACGGVCRNLQSDETNCGTCGVVCTANQVCQADSCFPSSTCPATTTTLCIGMGTTACGTGGGGVLCVCSLSAEGNVVCVLLPPPATCSSLTPCTSSVSCPAGQACVESGSCCSGGPARACLAPCPAPTAP